MQKAIIGKKVGMTQIFDETGKVIPVTVVEAGPCVVTQKKTTETDGYEAVQLGFESVKEAKLTKPEAGHLKKAGVEAKKYLKEFKLETAADMNVGDVVKADTFAAGDMIDVTGISKGHGYQGVIKRHGAGRTPMTHGGGPVHRHAGSMGATSHQSRIFKGKIGAGQMGTEQVTIENLEVVTILRAVHKYKDSREQFERRTHKRLIDILNPNAKVVEAISTLEIPAGVEIEIKL